MSTEFTKKVINTNETRYILEMTAGGTGSNAIASMPKDMGEVQSRTGTVPQKPRQGPLRPQTGGGSHRDKKKEQKKGQEKHKKPYFENDHEISMASNELLSIVKDAKELLMLVRRYSEMEGLEAWQQSKITKAADYLAAVLRSISGDQAFPENVQISEAFQNDEANVMYMYDVSRGQLMQKSIRNDQERSAYAQGYRFEPEQALRAHNIIRSKFNPNKFVQKQGTKWVEVFPFGKPTDQGVAEGSSDDVGNIYALHPDEDEGESVAILIKGVDLEEFNDLWTALPMDYLNKFGGDLPLWDSEDLVLYPNIKVKTMTFDQYVDLVRNYIRSDDMANTALSKMKKGVAEGVNDYLWHGSKSEHEILYPQQANDTGGKEESNKNAVYATPSAKVAIAMGLTTPDSDTGMFPNDPQMIMFSGKIRKGQMVYLHKVPKNLFIKHNDREWYSKPGVKEVKPLEIKAVPVDQWLHLIRQATPQDLELRKKHMKKQGVAEGSESQYMAARYIDEFGDGDHWYVKGTPEVIQRFVQLANSLEDEAVKGTEYEPGKGMMANIHSKLGDDSIPQWQVVKAQNLEAIKPIGNRVIQLLMKPDLSYGVQEFMSEFLWTLEEKGLALVTDEPQQGVAEDFTDDVDNIYAMHPQPEKSEKIAFLISDKDEIKFATDWRELSDPYQQEFGHDLPLWDADDLSSYPNLAVKRITFDQYVRLVGNYIKSKELAGSAMSKMKRGMAEEKIKGADGKACWKGKRYAGTKNGKDICIPVGEEETNESGLLAWAGRRKHGADYMKKASAAARKGASQEELGRLKDRYSKAEKVKEAEKKGLYYYVNKRKKAGTSRPASYPDAPSPQDWKNAAKTAKTEDTYFSELALSLAEKLDPNAPADVWIQDFLKSNAPSVRGKPKSKRIEQALAAKYQAMNPSKKKKKK